MRRLSVFLAVLLLVPGVALAKPATKSASTTKHKKHHEQKQEPKKENKESKSPEGNWNAGAPGSSTK